MMDLSDSTPGRFVEPDRELGSVVVPLLKGVIYMEDNPALWNSLLALEPGVRDYVSVMGLELILDEAEGYAFLRSRPESEETGSGNTGSGSIPRLVARRQLSYPVSLLLALLRKKLAESDVSGADTRMILSRDEVVEMVRIFLPEGTNEVKLIDNVDAQLNKIADLGFVRRLRGQRDMIEVRRIIKAFVDAQWLSDFDQRLTEYREHLGRERENG
jgi:hypothetical protein